VEKKKKVLEELQIPLELLLRCATQLRFSAILCTVSEARGDDLRQIRHPGEAALPCDGNEPSLPMSRLADGRCGPSYLRGRVSGHIVSGQVLLEAATAGGFERVCELLGDQAHIEFGELEVAYQAFPVVTKGQLRRWCRFWSSSRDTLRTPGSGSR